MTDDPALDELVRLESFSAARRVALDVVDRFEDVVKTLARISQSGIAS
jgi:hypothetical protein